MTFDQSLGAGVAHLLAGARRVVRVSAGVRPDEQVVIVTDVERPPDVAAALAAAVSEAGGVPLIVTMPAFHAGDAPSPPVAAALNAADVILGMTTGSLYHSAAVRDAAGARFVGLTGFTQDVLLSGGVFADFPSLAGEAYRLSDLLSQANRARITAPGGTDLTVNLAERGGNSITSMVREKGERTACPAVEASIAPIETSGEGVVVVDASASIAGVLADAITIAISRGRVIEISGGDAAQQIRRALERTGSPEAFTLAEIAFGLNPAGVIRGVIVEDEGVAGTGHIALGGNINFGGTSAAPIHLDFVYHAPTLWLDERLIIDAGRFLPSDA